LNYVVKDINLWHHRFAHAHAHIQVTIIGHSKVTEASMIEANGNNDVSQKVIELAMMYIL